jgi:hypothetical protein
MRIVFEKVKEKNGEYASYFFKNQENGENGNAEFYRIMEK